MVGDRALQSFGMKAFHRTSGDDGGGWFPTPCTGGGWFLEPFGGGGRRAF